MQPNLQKLNPKLPKLADRLQKALDLTFERVAAHYDNPKQFPLPRKSKSFERALFNLLEEVPARKRKELLEKASKTVKANTSERTRIYGDLAEVNLRSTLSVVDQIKVMPVPASMKLTQAEKKELEATLKKRNPKSRRRTNGTRPAGVVVDAVELVFSVQNLTCIKKTELGKDEISLAPFVIDNLENTLRARTFFVGKFKKGETLPVTEGVLQVSLNNGQFPKTFVGGCLLIEKDLLRRSAFVSALGAFLLGASAAMMTLALALVPGAPETGGFLAVAMVAGFITGGAGLLLQKLADDLASASDTITFDAPVPTETVFDRTLKFAVGDLVGIYEASVQWIAK